MSSIGNLLRVTTYGESHGKSIGCIIEGFPSGVIVDVDAIQSHLDRRKPGQSSITTSRSECDTLEIHSGIQNSISLGTPICMVIRNLDMKPNDYSFRDIPRPGHADLTYQLKYHVFSDSGGGRASARETASRVAAGGLCLEYLEKLGIYIVAWVSQVNNIKIQEGFQGSREEVETIGKVFVNNEEVNVRCPDLDNGKEIAIEILKAKEEGDSLGGVITCEVRGIESGFFGFIEGKAGSVLGYAVLSIPSVKGFRLLSSSPTIKFEVAFKPVSTIKFPQSTCDWKGNSQILQCTGRHDPCVLPRAVPIVEAMSAILILDTYLQFKLTL